MGTLEHINADPSFSPSRWWADRPNYTQRHTLATDGDISVQGNKIVINLDYQVNPL